MPSHTKKPGHAEKRENGCFLSFFRSHDANDTLHDTRHDGRNGSSGQCHWMRDTFPSDVMTLSFQPLGERRKCDRNDARVTPS